MIFEPIKIQIKRYKVLRQTWEINPKERIKESKKHYKRETNKAEERYLIEDAIEEIGNA